MTPWSTEIDSCSDIYQKMHLKPSPTEIGYCAEKQQNTKVGTVSH